MPKIEIITAITTRELQERVNSWINSNFENISEVYDIQVISNPRIHKYIATITYEVAHGK